MNAGQRVQTIGKWTQVHHFKWDATVKDRLTLRVLPAFRNHSMNWLESQRSLDYFEAHGGRFDPDDLKPLELPARDFIDWVGSGYQKDIAAQQAIATSDAVFSLQQTAVAQTQRKSKF